MGIILSCKQKFTKKMSKNFSLPIVFFRKLFSRFFFLIFFFVKKKILLKEVKITIFPNENADFHKLVFSFDYF